MILSIAHIAVQRWMVMLMARYVNADMAPWYLNDIACEQIKMMPEVKIHVEQHARWYFDVDGSLTCSNCGWGWDYIDAGNHMTRYCPDCGARMDDRTGQIERIDNT